MGFKKLNRSALNLVLLSRLKVIDKSVDGGEVSDVILKERCSIKVKLSELECREFRNVSQKTIVKWSIDGDKNSKYFQAILNKKNIGIFQFKRLRLKSNGSQKLIELKMLLWTISKINSKSLKLFLL